eukprot:4178959-Prymnesium_polylepis.1
MAALPSSMMSSTDARRSDGELSSDGPAVIPAEPLEPLICSLVSSESSCTVSITPTEQEPATVPLLAPAAALGSPACADAPAQDGPDGAPALSRPGAVGPKPGLFAVGPQAGLPVNREVTPAAKF